MVGTISKGLKWLRIGLGLDLLGLDSWCDVHQLSSTALRSQRGLRSIYAWCNLEGKNVALNERVCWHLLISSAPHQKGQFHCGKRPLRNRSDYIYIYYIYVYVCNPGTSFHQEIWGVNPPVRQAFPRALRTRIIKTMPFKPHLIFFGDFLVVPYTCKILFSWREFCGIYENPTSMSNPNFLSDPWFPGSVVTPACNTDGCLLEFF